MKHLLLTRLVVAEGISINTTYDVGVLSRRPPVNFSRKTRHSVPVLLSSYCKSNNVLLPAPRFVGLLAIYRFLYRIERWFGISWARIATCTSGWDRRRGRWCETHPRGLPVRRLCSASRYHSISLDRSDYVESNDCVKVCTRWWPLDILARFSVK